MLMVVDVVGSAAFFFSPYYTLSASNNVTHTPSGMEKEVILEIGQIL
jgi:hypothetical protein